MNILAVATTERIDELPDTPTLQELGYDLEFLVTRGLVAPKGTPDAILDTLESALATIAESESFRTQVANVGGTVRYMGEPTMPTTCTP